MPKDSRKMAAARSRWEMGDKEARADGEAKAVDRADHAVLSERQTERRKRRQEDKTGREDTSG
jgi:hypothetical protein